MASVQAILKCGTVIDIDERLPLPKKENKKVEDIIILPDRSYKDPYGEVEYYNRHREIKTKMRDWKLITKKNALQDLYVWDLISIVVDSLNIPKPKKKVGRPCANNSDLLKFAILKIYNGSPFSKTYSFNTIYNKSGYTFTQPKKSKINQVFNQSMFTPYLEKIYKKLADLLIPYENTFAIDSSGFGTQYNSRWIKVKYNYQKQKDYKKLHMVCGVNTCIICEAKITEAASADSPHMKELLEGVNSRFRIKRFCADAGYMSRKNAQSVADIKARPFIMPSKSASRASKGYPAWYKMIKLFQEHPNRFKKEYHLRSNAETVFSMMKTTLGDRITSKNPISQNNEILIRVIVHNLGVIVEAILKWGIDPYSLK